MRLAAEFQAQQVNYIMTEEILYESQFTMVRRLKLKKN